MNKNTHFILSIFCLLLASIHPNLFASPQQDFLKAAKQALTKMQN